MRFIAQIKPLIASSRHIIGEFGLFVIVKVRGSHCGPLDLKDIILDDWHQEAENHADISWNSDLQNGQVNYYLERTDQHEVVVARTLKENGQDKGKDHQDKEKDFKKMG